MLPGHCSLGAREICSMAGYREKNSLPVGRPEEILDPPDDAWCRTCCSSGAGQAIELTVPQAVAVREEGNLGAVRRIPRQPIGVGTESDDPQLRGCENDLPQERG